ncbi:hypothetical protein AK812_SmicGene36551 [Symbiodinium microadriaticum]|uniref:Uncharacterized protein n=1 Tax=Symbiodinium microadriaticum TaxID=2951 RepID=A0A1Q9CIL1_SYMMI|nr:hypothetical protein AK812_SmicGene36551 [Symbiodinium microadriaticum]
MNPPAPLSKCFTNALAAAKSPPASKSPSADMTKTCATALKMGEVRFVHEHLMSILKPFAEHVKELEKQVRSVRDEQIAQSSLAKTHGVGVGAVTAAQKTLEEAAACLKLDLTKLKSNMARSHDDVTKLIEVFSQANQERQEKLRKQFDEVTADQLKADAFTLQHLQDRLEVTKTQGEVTAHFMAINTPKATQSELQRLKTVESCHHQEAVDTIARLTTAAALGIRLDSTEKGLTSVEEAIVRALNRSKIRLNCPGSIGCEHAGFAFESAATLLQYDKEQASEESKQMNALERLAHHVHRIREELVEIAAKNHAEASEGISKVAAAAGANRDSYGTRMRSAEDEIRELIYCKDQMSADVDELQDSSQKVKTRLRIAEDGLQAAQADIRSQGSAIARTEDELVNTISRLDLAHEYWNGFGRGLQDTEQLVTEGKSGMPAQKVRSAGASANMAFSGHLVVETGVSVWELERSIVGRVVVEYRAPALAPSPVLDGQGPSAGGITYPDNRQLFGCRCVASGTRSFA